MVGSLAGAHWIMYSITTTGLMSGADQLTVRVVGPDASIARLVGGPEGSVHVHVHRSGIISALYVLCTYVCICSKSVATLCS